MPHITNVKKDWSVPHGLAFSFAQLIIYWDYVNDDSQFSIHQDIKGLEFDRVSVIMDDESAGGFLFSYEKLFGAKSINKY